MKHSQYLLDKGYLERLFHQDINDAEYVQNIIQIYYEQIFESILTDYMLSLNANDPLYQVLYELGFGPVMSSDPIIISKHHFVPFVVILNDHQKQEDAFHYNGKAYQFGVKRVWTRMPRMTSSVLECSKFMDQQIGRI